MVVALPTKPWINKGQSFLPLSLIRRFEEQYNAIYVSDGEFPSILGERPGPVALFWQPVKPQPDYDHYFVISRRTFTYFISSGRDVQKTWTGYQAQSGEIVYSRFRGDYRESMDGTAFTDMTDHHSGTPVKLCVHEDEVIIVK